MSLAPSFIVTRCVHGEHDLTCSCGDSLERLPMGGEWGYRSLRTGNSLESSLPQVLEQMSWEELAQADICLYSTLRAREVLGMLYSRHNHFPQTCGEHEVPLLVPECCESPMWLSPNGWVCRVEVAA